MNIFNGFDQNMDRRNIIKSVGSLTAMGMVGTVTAQNKNEKRIRELIKKKFQEDGLKGVKNELENHNLDYTETTSTLEGGKSEESEITPHYGYDEDESEITLMLAEGTSSDRIWATVLMELEVIDSWDDDYKGVDDAIGISFDDDHWSVVGPTYLTIDHPSGVEEDGDISWYSQSLEEGGLAAEVELPTDYYIRGAHYPPDWTNVSMMTELRNLDGVAGNIFGSYSHNGGSGYIDSVSGGAGPISIELSGWGSSTNFDVATDGDPDEYI